MINKGLVLRGRIFTFSVNLPDKPGQLVAVSQMLADADATLLNLIIISLKILTASTK